SWWSPPSPAARPWHASRRNSAWSANDSRSGWASRSSSAHSKPCNGFPPHSTHSTATDMRPEPGQVLHFSEDPTITLFTPHVAATGVRGEACVWAVDRERAPDYWFPRQCPRAMAWTVPATTAADRDRILGPG